MNGRSTRVAAAGLVAVALVPMLVGTHATAQSAGPAPGESLSASYRGSQRNNVEYQKVAPIEVFDNVYYVGPGHVSVWLISTSDGLILIDSAQEPHVDHVIDSVRKVGFDPKNIRYILLSHGHLDHFGGAAKIQQISGARVATLEEDWQLIEAAAKTPGRGGAPAAAPKRDMVLKEGQVITLGNTSITVYHLPGHTAGSASFEFTAFDNGRSHKAFVFGGPGQRNGVEGGTQFLDSIRRLKRELADVEAPLHVHSWLTTYPWPGGGAVFEPALKLRQRKPGEPHPFLDNAAWRNWLDAAEAGTVKYIADVKALAAFLPGQPRQPDHGRRKVARASSTASRRAQPSR
jgi:metallo-beta-lactamase class B